MRTSTRHRHNRHALASDWAKIKSIFAHTASDMRDKAGDVFNDSVDGIKNKSLEFKDQMAEYTADRPFKSLGIVFLVGLILGYFLHRR